MVQVKTRTDMTLLGSSRPIRSLRELHSHAKSSECGPQTQCCTSHYLLTQVSKEAVIIWQLRNATIKKTILVVCVASHTPQFQFKEATKTGRHSTRRDTVHAKVIMKRFHVTGHWSSKHTAVVPTTTDEVECCSPTEIMWTRQWV